MILHKQQKVLTAKWQFLLLTKTKLYLEFNSDFQMDKLVLEHNIEYLVVQTDCDPFTHG